VTLVVLYLGVIIAIFVRPASILIPRSRPSHPRVPSHRTGPHNFLARENSLIRGMANSEKNWSSEKQTAPMDEKETRVEEQKENVILPPTTSKWRLSGKKADGDVALALFNDPSELHEPIDPAEEARLVRKVDIRILILIGVCYAFFYIDKTTLS
jgi:hypothetical protein